MPLSQIKRAASNTTGVPSGSAVNIGGWVLATAPVGRPTLDVILAFSSPTIVQPCSYLLVALAFLLPFLAIAAISTIKTIYHPRYSIPVSSGLYLSLAGLIAKHYWTEPISGLAG